MHVGTNDLKSGKNPQCTGESVIDPAGSPKNEKCAGIIFNIIVRTDYQQLSHKATEFKKYGLETCKEMNLSFIGT